MPEANTQNADTSVPPFKLSFAELCRLPDVGQYIADTGRVTGEMLRDEFGIALNRANRYFEYLIRMNLLKPDRYSDHAAYLFTHDVNRTEPFAPDVGTRLSDEAGGNGTDGAPPTRARWVKLDDIHMIESINLRLAQDPQKVADYTDAYERGEILEPLELIDDRGRLVLAAGFHRFQAASRAGVDELRCLIRTQDGDGVHDGS